MTGIILGDGFTEILTQGDGVVDHAGLGFIPHRRWRNHPRPGIDFPDFSTVSASPALNAAVIDALAERLDPATEVIIGLDIGGAPLAGAIAYRRRIGGTDIRKVDAMRSDVIRSILQNYELGEGVA
ncbi:MAG: hypothetical protein ACRC7C_03970, partial [Beijerinckiaceae bacterium]